MKSSKYEHVTFGQFVLSKDVFDELDFMIDQGEHEGEYQLTTALGAVCEKMGLIAFAPHGKSFNIGLPSTYYKTFVEYGKIIP